MEDVAIIGAGAAGCAAAAILAPHAQVAVIDREAEPPWRIGETLPGAAARLLRRIGAWDGFVAAAHPQAQIRVSRWSSDNPETLDSFRDPDGAGWRLDRVRFERDLRATAAIRGASLQLGAGVAAVERRGAAWRLTLSDGRAIDASFIIDASGRRSRLLRLWGQRTLVLDRLACAFQLAEPADDRLDHAIYTQSAPDGWWYSAQIASGQRLVAFHSDADLPALKCVLRKGVFAQALAVPGLVEAIGPLHGDLTQTSAICSAASVARSAAGQGWLAAGDAALGFDPLSSQGLFNALATGIEAGEAALAALKREEANDVWRAYATRIGQIWQAYAVHLRTYYALERRWLDAPFWRRRVAPMTPPSTPE